MFRDISPQVQDLHFCDRVSCIQHALCFYSQTILTTTEVPKAGKGRFEKWSRASFKLNQSFRVQTEKSFQVKLNFFFLWLRLMASLNRPKLAQEAKFHIHKNSKHHKYFIKPSIFRRTRFGIGPVNFRKRFLPKDVLLPVLQESVNCGAVQSIVST